MGKLRPLWTPGGARGSSRPAGVPALATPPLANGVCFFEDFFAPSLGTAGWASGATATPDTLTNLAPLGHPAWIASEPIGTTGIVEALSSTVAWLNGCGTVNLKTGTTSGNTIALSQGATSTSGCATAVASSTQSALGQWRVAQTSAAHQAASNTGFGWISTTLAFGSDWITDPDTTLATVAALVFTRHIASYSGDPAGDLVARLYAPAASYSATSATIVAAAGMNATSAYKIEAFFDGINQTLPIYVNGALVTTFSLASISATSASLRCEAIIQSTSAATKFLAVDSYYSEQYQATAR